MAFTCTPSYTWVDGEVETAAKFNTAGAPTVADGQGYLFSNTGLTIKDTGGSNSLALVPGSAMTSARTLTIITGDASRSLTISGTSAINQDVTTAGNPIWTSFGLGGGATFTGTVGDLIITSVSTKDITFSSGGGISAIANGGQVLVTGSEGITFGSDPTQLINFVSGVLGTAPNNTSTPDGWIKCQINGIGPTFYRWIPFYA